jgi:uncharacterized membrane protein YdjX (TVP38/TMEM64 family)
MWRLVLLVLVLGGLYAVGKHAGYLDDVDIVAIKRAVEGAGAWGVLLFVGLFVVGVLLHVPGMFFVASGILVYGRAVGYVVSLAGATLAVCVSFVLVRTIGGEALSEVKRPFVRKLLARLDEHPVRAMIVLRLFVFIAPPINFLLALTRIRFRDYALGSALGLVVPMLVVTLAFDWLFATEWVRRWLFD